MELDISSLSDIVDLEGTQDDIESAISESSSQNVSSSESPQPFVFLLSRLRSPKPSDLSRKKKVTKNLPPVGKKKGKGSVVANPKSITPAKRVKMYSSEQFVVNSSNKLGLP